MKEYTVAIICVFVTFHTIAKVNVISSVHPLSIKIFVIPLSIIDI